MFINLNLEQPCVILLHLAHFEYLHMSGALEQVRQVRGRKRLLDLPKVDRTCGKWTLHSTCAYVSNHDRKMAQGCARPGKFTLNFPDEWEAACGVVVMVSHIAADNMIRNEKFKILCQI